MSFLFSEVIALADAMLEYGDDRPKELRALRDAEHPTTLYYQFLHRLCRRWSPLDVLEIGTYCGTSAAHMAWDNAGSVVTIDIQPDAKKQVESIGLSNITAITSNSSNVFPLLNGKMFDICYIDGWHDFNQTYGEYVAFRPLVRDGGLIIFDDVGLEMDGDEMNVFWEFVVDPKQRVDHLHPNTGFGICQKSTTVLPRPWEVVVGEAREKINRRKIL